MNADQMQFLLDKGLSFADAIDFARLAEKKKDPTNADRQARHREAKRNGVTVTRYPPIDKSSYPQDIPIEANASIAPRGRKPKSTKSHRLPEDWQPAPLTAETAAMVEVWQAGRLERELAKFKDYWKSASGRKATKDDWQAAYRFWLRNSDDWNANGTASRGSNQSGKPQNGFAAALRHVADGPIDEPFRSERTGMQ